MINKPEGFSALRMTFERNGQGEIIKQDKFKKIEGNYNFRIGPSALCGNYICIFGKYFERPAIIVYSESLTDLVAYQIPSSFTFLSSWIRSFSIDSDGLIQATIYYSYIVDV